MLWDGSEKSNTVTARILLRMPGLGGSGPRSEQRERFPWPRRQNGAYQRVTGPKTGFHPSDRLRAACSGLD
jgi:hypothetical protein